MLFEAGVGRLFDGGEEVAGAELGEQAVALAAVLHRSLHLGEEQVHPLAGQFRVEREQHVGDGGVDVGDRLGGDHDPAGAGRGGGHGAQHVLVEDLGVGEEQRGVPAEQHQSRDAAGVRLTASQPLCLLLFPACLPALPSYGCLLLLWPLCFSLRRALDSQVQVLGKQTLSIYQLSWLRNQVSRLRGQQPSALSLSGLASESGLPGDQCPGITSSTMRTGVRFGHCETAAAWGCPAFKGRLGLVRMLHPRAFV